jgi:hypothetical protein
LRLMLLQSMLSNSPAAIVSHLNNDQLFFNCEYSHLSSGT